MPEAYLSSLSVEVSRDLDAAEAYDCPSYRRPPPLQLHAARGQVNIDACRVLASKQRALTPQITTQSASNAAYIARGLACPSMPSPVMMAE